jgi:exodeoxyribonuclease VII small subunit
MSDEAEAADRSFEQALTELEERVRRLEGGDLSLEDSLGLFEEGIALTRECNEKLDAADQKLVELTRSPEGEVREREI